MNRHQPTRITNGRGRDALILSLGLLISVTGFFGQEIPWLLAAL